jgi:hypothetical protein
VAALIAYIEKTDAKTAVRERIVRICSIHRIYLVRSRLSVPMKKTV